MWETEQKVLWGHELGRWVGLQRRGCGQGGVDQSGAGQSCPSYCNTIKMISSVLEPFAVYTHLQLGVPLGMETLDRQEMTFA